MANRIQLRRGIKSKLPTNGAVGEPYYTIDTHELFVSTGSGNVNMGGSQWYTGTSLTGTGNGYSYSSCPTVKVGDKYLNTSTGYFYECTTAGSGTSAKWTYRGSIRGATGSTGAKGDKGERGAVGTIVIAASNSTAKSQAAADYVCDGTADQSEITSALSAIPSGGGKIVFAEGTYNISAAFAISKPVIFEGMGDGTQFNVSDALATCSATGNIVFRDMKITANTISKYLFKGSGNEDVLLDNVTLTMTATGQHNLGTDDAYAAFIKQRSFIANNSDTLLIVNCSGGGPYCFAVAENAGNVLTNHIPVRLIGGSVTLESSNGNAHISRNHTICDAVAVNYKSATGSDIVSAGYDDRAIMNNCRISYAAKINSESVHVAYSAVTNSIIYFEGTTFQNATLLGNFVACRYHNVKLQSNAVLCSSF